VREPFELDWLGGPVERLFHRRRQVEELPWGTLDLGDYPPELLERARVSWTQGAYNEYVSAAAFAELLAAMLAAGAPVDLVGMAGDFVADEMLHVELNARMAMELGGAAPFDVDLDDLGLRPSSDLSAFQRATELIIRVCCVGEAFSVPILTGSLGVASHPLTRAVLARIVKDEGPHAALGWFYLEWAQPRFDDAERARLGKVARAAIADYVPLWRDLTSQVRDGVTSEGYLLNHIYDLGWMDSERYAETATRALAESVVAPLARHGVEVQGH
jgi:hypothetical protein